MTLSEIIELARHDTPPPSRGSANPAAMQKAHLLRSTETRVLLCASALSLACAAAAASAALMSRPPATDPLDSIFLSVDWRTP
jgi:hypothetical protein